MKIAVLSNVNLDLLQKQLGKTYDIFPTEGYGQWITYALTQNKELLTFDPAIIFLLLDGTALLEACNSYEDGQAEIDQSISFVKMLAQNYKDSTIAVSTIDVVQQRICAAENSGMEARWEALWAEQLRLLTHTIKTVKIFDLKEYITREGRRMMYSEKLWYMGSIPYSVKSLPVFAKEISRFTEEVFAVRKKVFVIDLDNTIWGGVIGEDGPTGIVLSESLVGAAYRDTQKRIQEIGKTGILLAIVSKNNPEDVDDVFDKNPFMVLKKDDFVEIIANWEPKYLNIQKLAKRLNLGLDSFVFLDDNPVEREQVHFHLPEVAVVDFPDDVAMLPQTVGNLYREYFWCWNLTAEDVAKTRQYREESQRRQEMSSARTLEEYLQTLNIVISLEPVQDYQVERAVQLLNKTNQFNTNTVRMDLQQFQRYRNDPNNQIYVASVSDRYGDSGLVAEMLVHRDGSKVRIDNFLMSCRVMGRQIEHAIVEAIGIQLQTEGVEVIHSSYVPSAKNSPVEKLWETLGFSVVEKKNTCTQYERRMPVQQSALLQAEWKK